MSDVPSSTRVIRRRKSLGVVIGATSQLVLHGARAHQCAGRSEGWSAKKSIRNWRYGGSSAGATDPGSKR